jgi:hypothetical protein
MLAAFYDCQITPTCSIGCCTQVVQTHQMSIAPIISKQTASVLDVQTCYIRTSFVGFLTNDATEHVIDALVARS